MSKKPDIINSPLHYKGNGIETIDVIEAFDLDFKLGNAVKYILRCGKKGPNTWLVSSGLAAEAEDLAKARWYLDRVLSQKRANLKAWLKFEARVDRANAKYEAKRRRKR